MSEVTTTPTDLTSQYTAQVISDLEGNTKEQERIGTEIAALQQQLASLQHDHTVLVSMQQALGVTPAHAEPAAMPDGAAVPAPRKRAAAASATAAKKPTAKKSADKADAAKAGQPKLVELIRRHLIERGEPRSVAEVAAALGQAHPERDIKTTVVRTTLEGLVAKNRAQRTKQGTSVYYTAPDAVEQTAALPTEPHTEQAD